VKVSAAWVAREIADDWPGEASGPRAFLRHGDQTFTISVVETTQATERLRGDVQL
jgi:hypothetical protein